MREISQAIAEKVEKAVKFYLRTLIETFAVSQFTSLHQLPQGISYRLSDESKITLHLNKWVSEETTGFSFNFTGIVREFGNSEAVFHHLNSNWGLGGIETTGNIYDTEVFGIFNKQQKLFQSIRVGPDATAPMDVRRVLYHPVAPVAHSRRTANILDRLTINSHNYHHIIAHSLEEDLWLVHYINFSDKELKRFELLLQNFPYTYGSEFGRVPSYEEEINIYAQLLKFAVFFPDLRRVEIKYQSDIFRPIGREITDLFLRRTRLTHKDPEGILQKILSSIEIDSSQKISVPGAEVEKEATIEPEKRYAEILGSASSYFEVDNLVDLSKKSSYTKVDLPMPDNKKEKIGGIPATEGLEKTLVEKWQEGPLKTELEPEMLPQERDFLERIKKEEPDILSDIMGEKEKLPVEAPSVMPPKPPEVAPPPKGERTEGANNLLKNLLNILIVFLVIGSAAIAGYLYTSKTGSGFPQIPTKLPPTSEEPPSDGESAPGVPSETTPSSQATAPSEATPASSLAGGWERHRHEEQKYFFIAPANWFAKLSDPISTVSNYDPSKKEQAGPQDLLLKINREKEEKSEDQTLLDYLKAKQLEGALEEEAFNGMTFVSEKTEISQNYYINRGKEIFSIKITPVNYNPTYEETLKKILGQFKFFTPVEEASFKDYTNTIDNYTLKYPTPWFDKGLTTSEFGLFKNFSSVDVNNKSGIRKGEIWLSLGYLTKANLEAFKGSEANEDYFNYLLDQPQGVTRKEDSEYTVTKFGELTVSSSSAIKQSEEKASEYTVSVYVLNGNKIFQLSATSADEETWLNFEKEIDKIISSLSFK